MFAAVYVGIIVFYEIDVLVQHCTAWVCRCAVIEINEPSRLSAAVNLEALFGYRKFFPDVFYIKHFSGGLK